MTNKELQTIINTAQGGELKPKPQVWDRLETRLENNVKDQTIKRLTIQKTILGIASCVLITAVAVISFSTQSTDDETADYSSLAKSIESPSSLYAIDNVRKLNGIYNYSAELN